MLPGPTELIIVLVIILIFFGAGKLPTVLESFGDGIKKFRDAQKDEPPTDVTKQIPPKVETPASVREAEEVTPGK